jgi:amino-acid N-acetyltransferase
MTNLWTQARLAPPPGASGTRELPTPVPEAVTVRMACPDDAPSIFALVGANLEEGHLLPRPLDELVAHAGRFLLLTDGCEVVGCGELAPLSRSVAEIRSLVVDARWRGRGLGSRLVAALKQRARRDGFLTLCAFTHQPASFVRQGFSIVPHTWLPEKIAADCHACALFRRCGQFAMRFALS